MKTIFYYAYIGDDTTEQDDLKWRMDYIDEQMDFISTLAKKNNITSLYTVATMPKECDERFTEIATRHNFCVYTKLISRENCYEYPGFISMRDFAESAHPEHLIYYCHSKGSVNSSLKARGVFKYHQVININDDVTEILKNKSHIVKAGLFPSETGFLWHNFFWVKARYLKTKNIKKSSNRYYYEALIGGDKGEYRNVLCTLFINPPRKDFRMLDYFESKDILGKPALDLIYKEHISFNATTL